MLLNNYLSLLVFIFFFCIKLASAQVHGVVSDSLTDDPINRVNIFLEDSTIGTHSEIDGTFNLLNVPAGNHTFTFHHVGYQKKEILLNITSNDTILLKIYLKEKPIKLEQIDVFGNRNLAINAKPYMSSHTIPANKLLEIPGGFDDPLKSLQTLPGVVVTQDYTANFVMRGSGPAEHGVILDGLLLHNPYRGRVPGYGGFSIFNPEVIDNVELVQGGYNAQFGGRTGGIINITTKEAITSWKNKIAVIIL